MIIAPGNGTTPVRRHGYGSDPILVSLEYTVVTRFEVPNAKGFVITPGDGKPPV
jgi:hypothetical protein